jgi:hypothetical protein
MERRRISRSAPLKHEPNDQKHIHVSEAPKNNRIHDINEVDINKQQHPNVS